MAVIKGIEDNFEDLTAIDSILFGRGQFVLHDEVVDYAIPGIELVSILGTGIKFLDPLEIYAPKRGVKVNMANPASSFNSADLYSSGLVFAVNQQKYDSSYILTSLQFARRLFQYDTEVSSVELKLKPDVDAGSVKSKIQKILGDDFRVQDRYEQQADTFRIMEIEKLISYIFLTFILMIACFNVIGSLSMLIIDKKADVVTLRNLGASDKLITRIFLFEGRMISLMGAVIGVALGLILCFIQQEFGLLSLGGGNSGGNFVVDAYPVSVHAWDIVIVLSLCWWWAFFLCGIPCVISAAGCWAGNLFIIVDTADVCWFARYDLAAFFGFTLFVFWPYGFIWLSLFFFVVNPILFYG